MRIFNGNQVNNDVLEGHVIFLDNSSNSSTITGIAYFYNNSVNNGTIISAIFFDNAQNLGFIGSRAIFWDDTVNLSMSNAGLATFIFNESSVNEGAVSLIETEGGKGRCLFKDTSHNNGVVSRVTFQEQSYNLGIASPVYFRDSSTNGQVALTGRAIDVVFKDNTTNYSQCSGHVTFTNNSTNTTEISSDVTFRASSINLGTISAHSTTFHDSTLNLGTVTNSITSADGGHATFTHTASNCGLITGRVNFKDSSVNNNIVSRTAKFYDNSVNTVSGIVCRNAYFYNDAVNNGSVIEDVFFDTYMSGVGVAGRKLNINNVPTSKRYNNYQFLNGVDKTRGYYSASITTPIVIGYIPNVIHFQQNYTIEFWFYVTASGITESFFQIGDNVFNLNTTNSGTRELTLNNYNTGIFIPTLNWCHIAFQGVGNTNFHISVNGSAPTSTGDITFNTNNVSKLPLTLHLTTSYSNFRVIRGQTLYDVEVNTVPNAPLTLNGYESTSQSITGDIIYLDLLKIHPERFVVSIENPFKQNGGVGKYWKATSDESGVYDWANLSYWWTDSDCLQSAASLPQGYTDVILLDEYPPTVDLDSLTWLEPTSITLGDTGITFTSTSNKSHHCNLVVDGTGVATYNDSASFAPRDGSFWYTTLATPSGSSSWHNLSSWSTDEYNLNTVSGLPILGSNVTLNGVISAFVDLDISWTNPAQIDTNDTGIIFTSQLSAHVTSHIIGPVYVAGNAILSD